jgi:hypothetical protein
VKALILVKNLLRGHQSGSAAMRVSKISLDLRQKFP